MGNATLWINEHSFSVVSGLLIIILVMLVILLILQKKTTKLQKKYDFFTKGQEINIDQVLTNALEELEQTQIALKELQDKHQQLRQQVKGCLQKVKMERYDAFDAMGGELSYSLLLEDEEKNGVILTSIYGRDESRCFAKLVKKGVCATPLAEEEKKLM